MFLTARVVASVKQCFPLDIATDKRGYPHIFLISPQKHMLWVLIRSASANEYPRRMFLWRNKRYQHFSDENLFACVEVLRPSQPYGVISSAVSLPNHMFTGQA